MKTRLFAWMLAAPLFAAPLAGCDGTLPIAPVVPGGGAGFPTGGLTIVSFNVDPSQTQVSPGQVMRLSVLTNRPGARFDWSATGGNLSAGSGASATWTAPAASGTYRVDVTAREGGEEAQGSLRFTVR